MAVSNAARAGERAPSECRESAGHRETASRLDVAHVREQLHDGAERRTREPGRPIGATAGEILQQVRRCGATEIEPRKRAGGAICEQGAP